MFKLKMKKSGWIEYFKNEFGLIPSFEDETFVTARSGKLMIQAWQNADGQLLTTIFHDNEAIKHYEYDYKAKKKKRYNKMMIEIRLNKKGVLEIKILKKDGYKINYIAKNEYEEGDKKNEKSTDQH